MPLHPVSLKDLDAFWVALGNPHDPQASPLTPFAIPPFLVLEHTIDP